MGPFNTSKNSLPQVELDISSYVSVELSERENDFISNQPTKIDVRISLLSILTDNSPRPNGFNSNFFLHGLLGSYQRGPIGSILVFF